MNVRWWMGTLRGVRHDAAIVKLVARDVRRLDGHLLHVQPGPQLTLQDLDLLDHLPYLVPEQFRSMTHVPQ